MTRWLAAIAALVILGQAALAADEFRVEKLDDGPPADVLSGEVVAKLSPTGYKVAGADGKTVCEIWLARQLAVKPDFQPTPSIIYPLEPGSLAGALRFPRKGSDFRGQEIGAGVYTLRYGNQPEDGNHVGTFETRDFLLMLPAAADRDPKTLEGDDFLATSAESAGSTHPAIIPMLKPQEGDAPAIRLIEDVEWWVLRLAGSDAKGGKQMLELVVAGKAAE
ncbi:MAG: hypothetical protein WD063_01485 [Pirellulales bacterium]